MHNASRSIKLCQSIKMTLLMATALTVTLIVLLLPAFASSADSHVVDRGANGTPRFVSGDLGNLGNTDKDTPALRANARQTMQAVLAQEFDAPKAAMAIKSVSRDERGDVHVRFSQTLNGLKVYGSSMMLHARANGNVYAVNGQPLGHDLPRRPEVVAETAMIFALGEAGIRGTIGKSELAYVLDGKGNGRLAWKAEVSYTNAEGPQRDLIFADAIDGSLAARHPQHFYYTPSLNTKNCNQTTSSCSTVSTSSNDINTGDLAIDSAHNYARATHTYYDGAFGRNSINNSGMTLVSRVHYDYQYNNAFWDGSQMTYGDGDGSTFVPLSQDADVVAHELTHGVTSNESNLTYSYESGALNEAWSDIFGSEVDRYVGNDGNNTGTGAAIWLLGEDIYTPGTPGDGLRVMDDPVAAGDYDWYPTRYTGSSDNGGVHSNSGIANLAYVLLVDGGTHPRGKSSINVSSIGNTTAAKIFYEANVNCAVASTNFSGMRACTASKAASFFGQSTADTVHCAWDAVGVPGTSTCGSGGWPCIMTEDPEVSCFDGNDNDCDGDTDIADLDCPLPVGVLLDGHAQTGQAATTGNQLNFTMATVPGTKLVFTTTGSNGDADLYVRFGSAPTTSSYDCRSLSVSSNEICDIGTAHVGTYHVMVDGSFTDLSVQGDYTSVGEHHNSALSYSFANNPLENDPVSLSDYNTILDALKDYLIEANEDTSTFDSDRVIATDLLFELDMFYPVGNTFYFGAPVTTDEFVAFFMTELAANEIVSSAVADGVIAIQERILSGESFGSVLQYVQEDFSSSQTWSSEELEAVSTFADVFVHSSGYWGEAGSLMKRNHSIAKANGENVDVILADAVGGLIGLWGGPIGSLILAASYSIVVDLQPSGIARPAADKLTNHVPYTGNAATTGTWVNLPLAVSSGASNLVCTTTGSNGDADLYVKLGSAPTTSSYDCRSISSNSNESCDMGTPSSGTYHVGVYAYSTFTSLTVQCDYDTGGGGCGPYSDGLGGISGSTGAWNYYTQDIACSANMTVEISGGSGDADLYIRKTSNPTLSSYICRPWLNGNNETCTFAATSGDYKIGLYAYATYSGVLLEVSY
jgi:bacillolysin